MSHTPGPWDKIVKMDGFTAVGAKTLIARVFSQAFKDFENERANALLIAAAPDLLEACMVVKAYLDKLEAEAGSPDDPLSAIRREFHAPLLAKLNPAIAKAEGR